MPRKTKSWPRSATILATFLNRPAGLNALTLDMVAPCTGQPEAWARDSQACRCCAAPAKSLCAGGDIRSLYDSYQAGDTLHEDFSRNTPSTWLFTNTVNRCWR